VLPGDAFEQRPARARHRERFVAVREVVAVLVEGEFRRAIQDETACGLERVAVPRQERFERCTTGLEEDVDVFGLWRTPSGLGAFGERVPVQDRHAVVRVREGASGEQARHACADDDGVLAAPIDGAGLVRWKRAEGHPSGASCKQVLITRTTNTGRCSSLSRRSERAPQIFYRIPE